MRRFYFLLGLVVFTCLFSCSPAVETSDDLPLQAEYDPNKSLEYLTKIIEHDPDNESVRFLRARLFLELGIPIKAKEDLLEALSENPTNIDYLFLKARIDKELGQMEDVLVSIDKIQQLNKKEQSVDFLLFATEVNLEIANFNKAASLLGQATEYAPNYSHVLFQRANYYAYTEDTSKAFVFHKLAIKQDSLFDEAHIGLAELYLRTHHIDSSVWHLAKVKPTRKIKYQTILAQTLAQTGYADSSTKHWYIVLRQLPYDPVANYEMAKYYMAKGDMGSGVNFLKRIPENDHGKIKDYNYRFAVANELIGNEEIATEYYHRQYVLDSTVLNKTKDKGKKVIKKLVTRRDSTALRVP